MLEERQDKAVRQWLRTTARRMLVAWRIELGKVVDLVWAGHSQQDTERQRHTEGIEPAGTQTDEEPGHPGQGKCRTAVGAMDATNR
jgi:hypothetical protein